MGKKRVPVNIKIPTVNWLDRMIKIGVFSSYSDAARKSFRLLQEHTRIVYGTMNPKNLTLVKKREDGK